MRTQGHHQGAHIWWEFCPAVRRRPDLACEEQPGAGAQGEGWEGWQTLLGDSAAMLPFFLTNHIHILFLQVGMHLTETLAFPDFRESTGIHVRPLRCNYQSTGDFGESFAFLLQVLPLILCRFFFRLRAKTWTWKRGSHLMTMKQQEWGKSLVLKIDRKEILTGLGALRTSQNRWTAQCQTWSVGKHPSFCLVRPQQLSSGYRQTFPIPNQDNKQPPGMQVIQECLEILKEETGLLYPRWRLGVRLMATQGRSDASWCWKTWVTK